MTAQIEDVRAELGGPGRWKIVAGTGAYARLRGRGTFEGRLTGGDAPETFTFVTSWRGVADFDDVAPAVAISRACATKLTWPRGVYLVRVTFSARDDVQVNRLVRGATPSRRERKRAEERRDKL